MDSSSVLPGLVPFGHWVMLWFVQSGRGKVDGPGRMLKSKIEIWSWYEDLNVRTLSKKKLPHSKFKSCGISIKIVCWFSFLVSSGQKSKSWEFATIPKKRLTELLIDCLDGPSRRWSFTIQNGSNTQYSHTWLTQMQHGTYLREWTLTTGIHRATYCFSEAFRKRIFGKVNQILANDGCQSATMGGNPTSQKCQDEFLSKITMSCWNHPTTKKQANPANPDQLLSLLSLLSHPNQKKWPIRVRMVVFFFVPTFGLAKISERSNGTAVIVTSTTGFFAAAATCTGGCIIQPLGLHNLDLRT